MGRKRTKLELTAAQRTDALRRCRQSRDPRERERLRFALQAAHGRHTLEELADLTGRSRSTLQNWLVKFAAGGLAGLLQRDASPGKFSPIATPKIQQQLRAGLRSGRWRSAMSIAQWLQKSHGIRRQRKSIYYWIARNQEITPDG